MSIFVVRQQGRLSHSLLTPQARRITFISMITFNLSSSELYNKVANISKVIASKNNLPALNDILFQVSPDKVQLTVLIPKVR